MRVGFIGTGTIAEAMVRGMRGGRLADWPVVLSPRGDGVAARLAAGFAGVTVAADNQAVADGADLVVLAIRPQVAEGVVRGLRLRQGQVVLSLVAGATHATLRGWLGRDDLTVVRAIPLPFVAERACVTPVFPPEPQVMALFQALGGAVGVTEPDQYDGYGAASALMATYFGVIGLSVDWLAARGLPQADAERYLRGLFGALGDTLRAETGLSMAALREGHSTKGGLNEMVHDRFLAAGGGAALTEALDAVMARLRG